MVGVIGIIVVVTLVYKIFGLYWIYQLPLIEKRNEQAVTAEVEAEAVTAQTEMQTAETEGIMQPDEAGDSTRAGVEQMPVDVAQTEKSRLKRITPVRFRSLPH